ncbi:MAG: hypothetical protein ACFCBU_04165 [Cyanophyceae cyanobacterium]
MTHSELSTELNRIADRLLAIQEALYGAADMVRSEGVSHRPPPGLFPAPVPISLT